MDRFGYAERTIANLMKQPETKAEKRNLTTAEKAQAFLEEQLRQITTPERARRLSMTAFGGPQSGIPGGMGAVDFVPFLGSAKGVEEGARDVNQAAYDLESGRYGDALRNYGAAVLGVLPGAAGAVKVAPGLAKAIKAAPQDEALRLAQQRAALPPSQGGLGLPAENTPIERAQAMGFDYARRSRNPSEPFNDVNYAMFAEHNGDPDEALDRLRTFGKGQWLGRAEVPVKDIQKDIVRLIKRRGLNEPYQTTAANLAREANPTDIVNSGGMWDAPEIAEAVVEHARDKGVGGVFLNDGAIIWDPELIRSREAAFDPWRRDAATAAAFGVAAPDLLAKEKTEKKPKKDKTKKKPEGALSLITE